jgi:aryl sulfotransferase
MATPRRYQAHDEDSARWLGFPFRDGDIVISTRSKTGTTWVQMICALLIFGEPRLPAPIAELSPWLDHLITPREEVFAQLAAQQHRRFIKTHTPLDGIPLDPRVTYLVTARHPLDVAVSQYHHSANIDRVRLRQLIGLPEPATPPPPPKPLHDWLLGWIAAEPGELDTLPGFMWHLSDAWAPARPGWHRPACSPGSTRPTPDRCRCPKPARYGRSPEDDGRRGRCHGRSAGGRRRRTR